MGGANAYTKFIKNKNKWKQNVFFGPLYTSSFTESNF